MQPRVRLSVLLVLILLLTCTVTTSCQTGGVQSQTVAFADAGDELAVRFDFDSQTVFAIAQVDARGGLYSKFSQAPFIYGEWKKGTVTVNSKKLEFQATYQPGEPVPFWLQDLGIFLPGDVERWGLTFTPRPGP